MLICGGIGGGAQSALEEAGVELCAGAQGDADQAVEAYLKGELVSPGQTATITMRKTTAAAGTRKVIPAEDCGGSCGARPALTGTQRGKDLPLPNYRGTFNDGTQFDSSYDRGEPLEFICGAGQMIRGFDAAVADMEVGQVVDVHLMPEEAYGMPDPNAVFTLEIAQLPGSEDLQVGQRVYLSNTVRTAGPGYCNRKGGNNHYL